MLVGTELCHISYGKNTNLDVMGYFDFFLTFTYKNPALKSTLMNFDGNASTFWYPARRTNIAIVFSRFSMYAFLLNGIE